MFAGLEVTCPSCGKSVPECNINFHSLSCLQVKAPVMKDSDSVQRKQLKLSGAQKKQHKPVKSKESDDLDAMLAEMTLMDSSCGYQGCKKKVNLLGLRCRFCSMRFCMEHNIPEVHGCPEAAKKHARQVTRSTSNSGDAKRAHLHKKLESKLEELSSRRQSKSRAKSKK